MASGGSRVEQGATKVILQMTQDVRISGIRVVLGMLMLVSVYSEDLTTLEYLIVARRD